MSILGKLFNKEVDDQKAGLEFELTCAEILKKRGFKKIKVTQESRDQGADILAWKNGYRYAIQCKLYGRPVGNKAVQEVYAAKTFYGCHRAAVMTNQTFTKSAIELAEMTDVELWEETPTELRKGLPSGKVVGRFVVLMLLAVLILRYPILIQKDYLPISVAVLSFVMIMGLWIKHIFFHRSYKDYEDEEDY